MARTSRMDAAASCTHGREPEIDDVATAGARNAAQHDVMDLRLMPCDVVIPAGFLPLPSLLLCIGCSNVPFAAVGRAFGTNSPKVKLPVTYNMAITQAAACSTGLRKKYASDLIGIIFLVSCASQRSGRQTRESKCGISFCPR